MWHQGSLLRLGVGRIRVRRQSDFSGHFAACIAIREVLIDYENMLSLIPCTKAV